MTPILKWHSWKRDFPGYIFKRCSSGMMSFSSCAAPCSPPHPKSSIFPHVLRRVLGSHLSFADEAISPKEHRHVTTATQLTINGVERAGPQIQVLRLHICHRYTCHQPQSGQITGEKTAGRRGKEAAWKRRLPGAKREVGPWRWGPARTRRRRSLNSLGVGHLPFQMRPLRFASGLGL